MPPGKKTKTRPRKNQYKGPRRMERKLTKEDVREGTQRYLFGEGDGPGTKTVKVNNTKREKKYKKAMKPFGLLSASEKEELRRKSPEVYRQLEMRFQEQLHLGIKLKKTPQRYVTAQEIGKAIREAAEKKGRLLSVSEAFNVEMQRQKSVGQNNLIDGLNNLILFVQNKGKINFGLSIHEKPLRERVEAEVRREERDGRVKNKRNRIQLMVDMGLSPGQMLALETAWRIEEFTKHAPINEGSKTTILIGSMAQSTNNIIESLRDGPKPR